MTGRSDVTVVGAGPAGLVAAATLARAGISVRAYEKAGTVGHRFSGDFQGLENWSGSDVLDRLERLGASRLCSQASESGVFYDRRLRPTLVSAPEPLFYLVRRGPDDDTLDTALLNQAQSAGVKVHLREEARRARAGDIIAIGPDTPMVSPSATCSPPISKTRRAASSPTSWPGRLRLSPGVGRTSHPAHLTLRPSARVERSQTADR